MAENESLDVLVFNSNVKLDKGSRIKLHPVIVDFIKKHSSEKKIVYLYPQYSHYWYINAIPENIVRDKISKSDSEQEKIILTSGAQVEVDLKDRILIPPELRDIISVETGSICKITGGEGFRIHNLDFWTKYYKEKHQEYL